MSQEKEVVESIRVFNRFFTHHVGAIDDKFLGNDISLPETRILFEIANFGGPINASSIANHLNLNKGYLSRVLARFSERGWLTQKKEDSDGRFRSLELTDAGRKVFEVQDKRQREVVIDSLADLSDVEKDDLLEALTRARVLLAPSSQLQKCEIRPFRIGEASWIVMRQAKLYEASHGWGVPIEAIAGKYVSDFLSTYKPGGRQQCFVAEVEGHVLAGGIIVTDEGNDVARLRLLHVEPFARKRGIGESLVTKVIDFCREKQFKAVELWTQSVLEGARRIYARNGFTIVSREVHTQLGEPVEGEMWRKLL